MKSLSTTKEKRYGYSSNTLVKSRSKTRIRYGVFSLGGFVLRSGSKLIAGNKRQGAQGTGTGILPGNKPEFIMSEVGQGRPRACCA